MRTIYSKPDYKIYAVVVDENKYPDLKQNKYGNVSILGELHELGEGIQYDIIATEQENSQGISYKVLNIRRDRPTSESQTLDFLREVLTYSQADTLYRVYPDIIERVVNEDLKDIDFTKLKGIKEKTFEAIKRNIVDNFCLVDLVTEFHGLLTLTMCRKLYDKYTSVKVLKKKLKEDPYKCLCGLAGVGFRIADKLILNIDSVSQENIKNGKKPIIEFNYNLKTSIQRCLSCVLYLLEENESNGHTYMDIIELKNQCKKLVPACSSHFPETLKHKSIIYNKEFMSASVKKTYDSEKYIANKILDGLNGEQVTWEFPIEKYKMIEGIELQEEQLRVLDFIKRHQVVILNGAAGTGKSFSTKAVIQMLTNNRKSFSLFSPTGKAAKVLAEYSGHNAKTIHRGLGYTPPNEWKFNAENQLNSDVVIVDEFSMTDVFLFEKLLNAINLCKTKLLIIGDNDQLPSVACGNLLHDFMTSNVIPTVTLTSVFRYGEGGLMKVATDVRNSKTYMNHKTIGQFAYFGENKDYAFVNIGSESLVKHSIELYKKLLIQGYIPSDIQVLTAYRKGDFGSVKLNESLQKVANKSYGSSDFIKVGEQLFFQDDIVMQTVNNYKATLYSEDKLKKEDEIEVFIANGEMGVIKEVFITYVIINFDGVLVKYSKSDLINISLGYSLTIHKSQGSSSKIIILLTPQAHTFMLNSNLIYVGLTRMKERCFHLGNAYAVNQAIKKKANLIRNTNMSKLLVK